MMTSTLKKGKYETTTSGKGAEMYYTLWVQDEPVKHSGSLTYLEMSAEEWTNWAIEEYEKETK